MFDANDDAKAQCRRVEILTGPSRRRRWSAEEKARIVEETLAPGAVAVLLRAGTTPSGAEIRGHLRRLVRRIRTHWPNIRLTVRGDGHYGRPEVMAWCEDNEIDYVFG